MRTGQAGASELGRSPKAPTVGKYFPVTLRFDMTAMDGGNAARGRMPKLPMSRQTPLRPTRTP